MTLRPVPDLPVAQPEKPHLPVTTLGALDSVRVLTSVVVPTLAAGVIRRRPRLMWLTERWGLDRRAIATLTRLRERHGGAPVAVRVPGRSLVLPLSEVDAGRVLAGTPDPFTPATTEKRAALRHFQPHGVLISTGRDRDRRRAFTEAALEPERELHSQAGRIAAVVREEIGTLPAEIDWDSFARVWWRAVRRIVLGDQARDDDELTDLLGRLRAAGNWAYLHPLRRRDRARFDAALAEHLRSPSDRLATAHGDGVDPAGQAPHWLFAFDAAGMVTVRTLALLARHPRHLDTARAEGQHYTRACVLDTIRLWPTTPALLRESVRDTGWGPPGTTTFLHTPLFHRDPVALPWADRFAPETWLDGTAAAHPALVPFSAGAGQCPGRNVVLHATSTAIATVLDGHDITLLGDHGLHPPQPLPATLDNTSVRLRRTFRHPVAW
ncbi:cytochrome P450 [Actinophytocola xinjiangensis]|uniref:cytochrome P450 n=1 Tax=Actinophytocola xinjiangensis TaxID=485602 RepID=UPI000A06850B|nr:cytochrome P450 [Actinophytocola xinjiangensis]